MAGSPLQRLTGECQYSCATCLTHVTTHEQLVSKAFQGRHGRAFLFTTATNVELGPKEERILMTGLHSVADIYCKECSSRLGWKYLEAFENRHASLGTLEAGLDQHPLPFPPSRRRALSASRARPISRNATMQSSQKYKEGKFIVEKSRVVEGRSL